MHLNQPWVVKVGGRLCDDASVRAQVAQACKLLARPLVLVHGGGCVVSDMQTALGLSPHFVQGRRVTDAAAMRVVEMALSGHVNKDLTRALQTAGRPAVGLSGIDGQLVRCNLVPDLGCVGEPIAVEAKLLLALLQAGFTPVVSPVSLGPQGEAVNVNADEFACAVACALRAHRLLLLSDVDAVQVDGAAQAIIVADDIETIVSRGEAHGGMVPKLRAAAMALAGGVQEVCIGGFASPLEAVRGTQVVRRAGQGSQGA